MESQDSKSLEAESTSEALPDVVPEPKTTASTENHLTFTSSASDGNGSSPKDEDNSGSEDGPPSEVDTRMAGVSDSVSASGTRTSALSESGSGSGGEEYGTGTSGLSESGSGSGSGGEEDMTEGPRLPKKSPTAAVSFVKDFMRLLTSQKRDLTEDERRELELKTREKRERKRLVNRKSAQRKRAREKQELDELSERFNCLHDVNEQLRKDNEQLQQLIKATKQANELQNTSAAPISLMTKTFNPNTHHAGSVNQGYSHVPTPPQPNQGAQLVHDLIRALASPQAMPVHPTMYPPQASYQNQNSPEQQLLTMLLQYFIQTSMNQSPPNQAVASLLAPTPPQNSSTVGGANQEVHQLLQHLLQAAQAPPPPQPRPAASSTQAPEAVAQALLALMLSGGEGDNNGQSSSINRANQPTTGTNHSD